MRDDRAMLLAAGGIAMAIAAVSTAGRPPTLGWVIVALVSIACIVPPLSIAATVAARAAVGAIAGVGLGWIVSGWILPGEVAQGSSSATAVADIGLSGWSVIAIVISAWALVLAGATSAMRGLGVGRWAGGIVATLAIAWLAWPVLVGARLAALPPLAVRVGVSLHPVFAVEAAVDAFAPWTETPLLYRHTTLGQDVPFSLASPWAFILTAGITGLVSLVASRWRERVRHRHLAEWSGTNRVGPLAADGSS